MDWVDLRAAAYWNTDSLCTPDAKQPSSRSFVASLTNVPHQDERTR